MEQSWEANLPKILLQRPQYRYYSHMVDKLYLILTKDLGCNFPIAFIYVLKAHCVC